MLLSLKSRLKSFFLNSSGNAILTLSILRISISLLVLIQAILLTQNLEAFYTSSGILHPILNDNFSSRPLLPKLTWFVSPLMLLGFQEITSIHLIYALYLTSLIFLFLGLKTKVMAIFACFFHLQIYTSGYYSAYGVDHYTHFILYYFIWIPCSEILSVDSFIKKQNPAHTKAFAIFSLRIIQMHLLATYVGAGVEKALGADWMQGEAVWRALMLPGFGQWDVSWLAFTPSLSYVLSWGTLVLEIFYPIALGINRLRNYWVMAICLMHLGIAFGLGMILFSSVMIALNCILFLVPTSQFSLHPKLKNLLVRGCVA